MNEVETIEKRFYELLYNFYKCLRTKRGYLHSIIALYQTLEFLSENKDYLQDISKTDIHNLFILSRALLRKESENRKYNLNRTKKEIIEKHLEDLAYLESESVKR